MTETLSVAQFKKLKPKNKYSESQLQSECVKWFRLAYPKYADRLFAIPNGGKRNRVTAAILKREGAMAGVSDLFLAVPAVMKDKFGNIWSQLSHHGIFIEMKRPGGTLSDAQEHFINTMQNDYRCIVCRSFDEFKKEIDDYLS